MDYKILFSVDVCEDGKGLAISTSNPTKTLTFTLGKAGSTTVTTLKYMIDGWNNAVCTPSKYDSVPAATAQTLITAGKLT